MGYGKTNIAGGGLRIKSSQMGTYFRDGYGTQEDIKINPVDLSSSIAVVWVEQERFDQDECWYTIEFKDSTTISIERRDNDSIHMHVHWAVYELAGFKSLQFASVSVVKSNVNEPTTKAYATIQPVNVSKCLVFTSLRFELIYDNARPGGWVRLASSTQVEVANTQARSMNVTGNAFIVELR